MELLNNKLLYYMKKFLLASMFILLGTFAFAQNEEGNTTVVETNTTVIEGANSTDEKVIAQVVRETRSKEFNHWMISFGGGANLMLTERYGTHSRPIKNYQDNFQGAFYFNVGYMINPIWGVIAEYGFIPINKKIFTEEGDETGFGHEATIQLDFNILNLVRKCRSNTKWNVDALLGAGFLAYNSRYDLDENGEKDHYYYPAICLPITLKFQYCPIQELGIGLRFTFKWYSEDDINFIYKGETNHNNDMALYGGLELQYNITTKNKSHVRVTDRCTYEPMNVVLEGKIVDTNKNAEKLEEIEKELDDVKEEVAVLNGTAEPRVADVPVNNGDYDKKLDAMQDKIDALERRLNGMQTPSGNQNNQPTTNTNTGSINREYPSQNASEDLGIYFDFDSYKIKPEYYKEVIKIAKRMISDKNVKAKIIGFCDEEGTNEYNKTLAQNRVDAVINILVNRFKISRDRFTSENVGRIEGAGSDIRALNRRVDVEFYY